MAETPQPPETADAALPQEPLDTAAAEPTTAPDSPAIEMFDLAAELAPEPEAEPLPTPLMAVDWSSTQAPEPEANPEPAAAAEELVATAELDTVASIEEPVLPSFEAVAAAPAEPPPATTAPASTPAPAAANEAVPVQPPAPPPIATRPQKAVPLPRRATIALELTLESNNYKVWATQHRDMADGRYRVLLTAEARALFFTLGSIVLESSGVVSADGLRPERYVDERNKRRTTVDFSANEKTAYVEEANGNRKTLALAGQAADIMSLTYDLAFNPDINVGAPFTLSNRDTIEEIRLVAKREESLTVESGTRMTRFYDFRRPDGSGGIQVWLSPENGWLPAKIRILGRDGALTMVATRYDLNPPDSR